MMNDELLEKFGAIRTEDGVMLTHEFCLIEWLGYYQENHKLDESNTQALYIALKQLEQDLGICAPERHNRFSHEREFLVTCSECGKISVIPYDERLNTVISGMELTIEQVPASRCTNCGEIFYDAHASKYIDQQINVFKEQMRMGKYRIFSYPDKVQLWIMKRLSYEPKGWEQLMRDELRHAVSQIDEEEFSDFYFRYAAEDQSKFDLENILTYNVGVNAFHKLRPHHLVMERSYAKGNTDRSELSSYPILMEYDTMIPEKLVWKYDQTLVFWETSLIPLRADTKPATIWQQLKNGYLKSLQPSGQYLKLGIKLKLSVPDRASFKLFAVLKPLIDGTVAAFHSHDGSEIQEASERLSVVIKVKQSVIQGLLMDKNHAVLGQTRLVYPYRNGVMWNPADERLVHTDIEIVESIGTDNWYYSGELFSVKIN